MDLDMNIPIPSLLFGIGGKCILNWALVLFQKGHIWRSFVGVFSLSLAVVDTFMTLTVTIIHLGGDTNILGWRLTRYHVCLLPQILGYVYSSQHVTVLIISTLEHLFVVSRRVWKPTWIFRLVLTFLTWGFSILYVFNLSVVRLYVEDTTYFQINHCWISSSSAISELAIVVGCLCLCWTLFHLLKLLIQLVKVPHSNYCVTLKSQIRPRLSFAIKVVRIFLDPWALFIAFMFFHVVIPVEMPSHLGLNCAWLCFLNSLLIALALCVVSPAAELSQGSAQVPPDSFCDWRAEFSLANGAKSKFTIRERRT